MGMNKKGIFYVFIAMIFLLSIGMLFYLNNSYDYTDSKEAVSARAHTLDDFIKDLNNDMSKASYIAAFRALIAMEEEITLKGEYFNDSEKVFREAFFNGTIEGENRTILNKSSFSDYLNRVEIIADKIGADINVTINRINLTHKGPWHVTVIIDFKNEVVDQRGVASWEYEKTVENQVPIASLRDPLYSVGTKGRSPNTIRKTNVSYFIYDVNNANDTTNLMNHTDASYYIASEQAPSYMMRFEGNFSNSTYGIESLVNIDELQDQGLSIKTDRSIVDHIYFDNNLTNASTVCTSIINTPTWFKIDEPHLTTYEIDPKLNPEGEGYIC